MARPGKTRRLLYRLSLVGLVLTALLAAYSEIWGVCYTENVYGPGNHLRVFRSGVTLVYYPIKQQGMFTGIPLFDQGWQVPGGAIRAFVPRNWIPKFRCKIGSGDAFAMIDLPLWIPGLLFGFGTWWGWRRTRLLEPWQCRGCGYDVRGVVGGRCPECGRLGQ